LYNEKIGLGDREGEIERERIEGDRKYVIYVYLLGNWRCYFNR
jgi:hypothetical protein